MVVVPTRPLNIAKYRQASEVQWNSAAAAAAKNQKNVAPAHVDWNPVFHFAGPMAEMMMPRRAAYWRNTVITASRPRTTSTTHSGNATTPNGVTSGHASCAPDITGPTVPGTAQSSAPGSGDTSGRPRVSHHMG